ncbi:hypothetical protein HN51_047767, partial [Arachis hypogaea]
MSASQRKGKGKATTGKRKRGESAVSIIDLMHNSSWREKNFTQQEKADQLLPANDFVKFANRYCELKYPAFANSRNLYLEKTLKISEALQQCTTEQIKQRGWSSFALPSVKPSPPPKLRVAVEQNAKRKRELASADKDTLVVGSHRDAAAAAATATVIASTISTGAPRRSFYHRGLLSELLRP